MCELMDALWNVDTPKHCYIYFQKSFHVNSVHLCSSTIIHLSTLYRTEIHALWGVNSTITSSDQAIVSVCMLQLHEAIYSATFFQFQDSKSPMSPVAPPELHILENSTTAGVYTLDLTQAMPEHGSTTARNEDGPTGVIIRIQDIQSGNMTYIQLVHFSLYDIVCVYFTFAKFVSSYSIAEQSLSHYVDCYH